MDYMILEKVRQGVNIFLSALQIILVAYSIMSWITSPYNRLYMFLSRMVQPLVAPFRRVASALIRRGLRIDISVLLALIVLQILQSQLVPRLFYWMMDAVKPDLGRAHFVRSRCRRKEPQPAFTRFLEPPLMERPARAAREEGVESRVFRGTRRGALRPPRFTRPKPLTLAPSNASGRSGTRGMPRRSTGISGRGAGPGHRAVECWGDIVVGAASAYSS